MSILQIHTYIIHLMNKIDRLHSNLIFTACYGIIIICYCTIHNAIIIVIIYFHYIFPFYNINITMISKLLENWVFFQFFFLVFPCAFWWHSLHKEMKLFGFLSKEYLSTIERLSMKGDCLWWTSLAWTVKPCFKHSSQSGCSIKYSFLIFW